MISDVESQFLCFCSHGSARKYPILALFGAFFDETPIFSSKKSEVRKSSFQPSGDVDNYPTGLLVSFGEYSQEIMFFEIFRHMGSRKIRF